MQPEAEVLHPVGAFTPLSPALGGHTEHTVHSLHGEEEAVLVLSRVVGGETLWFRREGGGN